MPRCAASAGASSRSPSAHSTAWRRSSAAAGCRGATCWRAASACWSRPTACPASRRAACWRRPPRRPPARPTRTILVSLYLDGGNDGLNTLVPLGDPRYAQLRSRIGVDPATALPLAAHRPASAGTPIWPACASSTTPARSPCSRRSTTRTPTSRTSTRAATGAAASWGPRPTARGWLGRTLDVIGTHDNPLQGIHVGWGQDPSLNGHRAPVATVSSPSDFGFYIPDVWDEKSFLPIYRRLSHARAKHPGAGGRAVDVRQHDRDARPARAAGQGGQAGPAAAALPRQRTSARRSAISGACSARASARASPSSRAAASTRTTHRPRRTPTLLQDLGDSLRAWQADLDARGLSERVLTMIWSEFGRRPEDNDSGGTDHGAGGLLLLVGNRANGGIRSEFPGLGAARRRRQPGRHDRLPQRLRDAARGVARRRGLARAAARARRPSAAPARCLTQAAPNLLAAVVTAAPA